jgi:hypothetical protein
MPRLEYMVSIDKHKIGRYNDFLDRSLMGMFMDIPEVPGDIEAPGMVSTR